MQQVQWNSKEKLLLVVFVDVVVVSIPRLLVRVFIAECVWPWTQDHYERVQIIA